MDGDLTWEEPRLLRHTTTMNVLHGIWVQMMKLNAMEDPRDYGTDTAFVLTLCFFQTYVIR